MFAQPKCSWSKPIIILLTDNAGVFSNSLILLNRFVNFDKVILKTRILSIQKNKEFSKNVCATAVPRGSAVACQWGRQCLHHMMPHQRGALCVGSCPPRIVAVEANAGQHLLRGAHCNGFALTPSGANHDDTPLAMCMFAIY